MPVAFFVPWDVEIVGHDTPIHPHQECGARTATRRIIMEAGTKYAGDTAVVTNTDPSGTTLGNHVIGPDGSFIIHVIVPEGCSRPGISTQVMVLGKP